MSVYFQHNEQHILVQGKTYPYRDLMRTMGGQYQAAEKIWLIPTNPENLARIQELCRSVGGGRSKEAPPPRTEETTTPSETASSPPVGTSQTGDGLTISELMQKTQLAIAEAFPRSLWVLGEIQNIKYHATGIYFQLADFKEGASRSATMTVNATLWRSQMNELERKIGAASLKELLQDGIRVRLLVDVSLYRDRGQISLQVQGIDPSFTKGSLALARERLLRELRAKGVDRQNKSLSLTAFPFHIGLISAPDSRAKSDFLDQLQLYGFPGEVSFVPAQMQGEKTLEDVVQGLKYLQDKGCDLIVVTRGGGSAADLRWFDSPEIAYAIAACTLPVIAAIGHHEDVCIAEEICFQREKTPTAAADFILSLFQKTRERLEQLSLGIQRSLAERTRLQDQRLALLRERLMTSVQQVLLGYGQQLASAAAHIEMQTQRRLLTQGHLLQQLQQALGQELDRRCQNQSFVIEQLARAMQAQSERRFFQEKERLFTLERAIVQRDPGPWMKDGWTQLIGPQGRLTGIKDLHAGAKLKAPMRDGVLHLTVDAIEAHNSSHEIS